MSTSIMDIAPLVPSDKALEKSHLPDKALALNSASARLAGQLSPIALVTLERHMRVINSLDRG